jgi:hypothetical protein
MAHRVELTAALEPGVGVSDARCTNSLHSPVHEILSDVHSLWTALCTRMARKVPSTGVLWRSPRRGYTSLTPDGRSGGRETGSPQHDAGGARSQTSSRRRGGDPETCGRRHRAARTRSVRDRCGLLGRPGDQPHRRWRRRTPPGNRYARQAIRARPLGLQLRGAFAPPGYGAPLPPSCRHAWHVPSVAGRRWSACWSWGTAASSPVGPDRPRPARAGRRSLSTGGART